MGKTRTGIIGSLIDFINSFRNSGSVNDGRVYREDLNTEGREELDRVENAGKNVKKIEKLMNRYREEVDTSEALKTVATEGKGKVINNEEQKIIDDDLQI